MPRPASANFVDTFFKTTLFQPEDGLAAATLQSHLSPSAQIVINGKVLSTETFISLITTQFRQVQTATVESIQDLNIATDSPGGETGVVGQFTIYTTTNKNDGVSTKQSATTIVQVTKVDGRLQISGLWEAQTPHEA